MTNRSASRRHSTTEPLGTRSIALVLLTAGLWGGTPVAITFSVEALPPVAVAAFRFTMAAVFMFIWCRLRNTPIKLKRGQIRLVLVAGSLLFLQIATFNIGTDWSNSSHSAMLINTFVFWVMLIEHFVTKSDRVTVRKLAGVSLAALGVLVILTASSGESHSPETSSDSPTIVGDAVLLVSAFLLALRVVYVKRSLSSIEPGTLIFWHDVVGVAWFAAYSMLAEQIVISRLTAPAVLGLLYQGFLVAGLCFAIQAQLLRKHSAVQISMFSFATPLFGVLFAVVFRQDPISPWLFLAAICVAVGIYLVNWRQERRTDSTSKVTDE